MRNDRRVFLMGWLAVAGAPLVVRAAQQGQNGSMGGQQSGTSTSRPVPIHSFPDSMPPGAGTDSDSDSDSDSSVNPNPRAVLQADRKDLQHDVAEILEMAQDLKKQVDSLDTTQVLSLDVVHKAEGIEKLAHQVKMLMQEP
jgi:hypothetical protein